MKKRNLTVYCYSPYTIGKTYPSRPQIIIQGRWLADLGFSIGEKVTLTCEEDRIVIEKASASMDTQENKEIGMVAEPDNPYGRG